MCYTGGPRCYAHVSKELNDTRMSMHESTLRGDDETAYQSYLKVGKLQMELNSTPKGQSKLQSQIDTLRDTGNHDEAERLNDLLDTARSLREMDISARRVRLAKENVAAIDCDSPTEDPMEARRMREMEEESSPKHDTEQILRTTPLKKLNPGQLAVTLINESRHAEMDTNRVRDCMSFALVLHEGQTRGNRGGMPKTEYIEHPLRNSIRLLRYGVKDEKVILASILHDTVEDCAQKYCETYLNKRKGEVSEPEARALLMQEITRKYGADVSGIVHGVTNAYITPEDKKTRTTTEKNREYYNHVVEQTRKDSRVFLVKLSDFIDNAAGLHHNDIPGNERGVTLRAIKYLPVADVLQKLTQGFPDLCGINPKGRESIIHQLSEAKPRLRKLAERPLPTKQ